jgi:Tol biopolymer transport system component
MPEEKRPLKVFLSHAHMDREAVKALYDRLTTDGVDAWLDKEKLLPGQDWELEIRKAVREADVVVVCLSKQFNQAGYRQKEVRIALDTAMEQLEGEIFIIPARLEECDTLESLRKWHWVDLFEENGYETLMRALGARATNIGAAFQIKKSWLPKITSPRSKSGKVSTDLSVGIPISVINPKTPIEGEKSDSYSPDFSSIDINLKSVIKENISRKRTEEPLEKSQSKKVAKKSIHEKRSEKTADFPQKEFRLKKEYVMAVIGAVATIIAGILVSPLIEKWFSNMPPIAMSSTLTPTPLQVLTAMPTDIPETSVNNNEPFGKIAFISDRDCINEKGCQFIYIMNADGSDVKRITTGGESSYHMNPVISPDGNQLVFIKKSSPDQIYLIDLNTLKVSFLTTGSDSSGGTGNLSWSGDQLIFSVYIHNEELNKIRDAIEVFSFQTGEKSRLTSEKYDDFYPSFSYDGEFIVFNGDEPLPSLYTMNSDGTNREMLFIDMSCLFPAFSPTDYSIAVQCRKNDNWDLFIYDTVTNSLIQITDFPSDESYPSWSPDGNWLVFNSNMDDPNYETCSPHSEKKDCNEEIYIVRRDGSGLKRLTDSNSEDENPNWGP